MKKIEIEIEHILDLDENGFVNSYVFFNNSDFASTKERRTFAGLVKEFIDVRSVKGKIADYHLDELKKLKKEFKNALEVLDKA